MVAGVPLFAVGSGYLVKFSRPIVSVLVSLHLIYPDDIEQAMGVGAWVAGYLVS